MNHQTLIDARLRCSAGVRRISVPRRAFAVAISALFLSQGGCIMYEGRRSPDLVGRGGKAAEVRSTPRIDVRLEHRQTMDGRPYGDLSYRKFESAFQRVRQEFPFLANAQLSKADPDYILTLRTEQAEFGETMAMVSGFTLTVVPAMIHSMIIVEGDLQRIDGEQVGTWRAVGEVKGIVQILLILALPALPFTAPGEELYDDTFRDFFLQMAPRLDQNLEASVSP